MLISMQDVYDILNTFQITLKGVLHIGAHDCEELVYYREHNISDKNIVWIDALPQKVEQAKKRGVQNIYHAVITDKDDEDVVFHVSNNCASSSVLELGTHSQEHPSVVYVNTLQQKSKTINKFIRDNHIDIAQLNFWNFDIQGAELLALKGATEWISYADALFLEVNEKELYKNCGLIGEIDTFLEQHHFKRVKTYMTQHGWGDALYVRVPI